MANSKKSSSTKSETAPVTTPATVVAAATPATKSSSKKSESKKSTAPATEPVVAVVAQPDTTSADDDEKKGRRVVSKQSVYDDFVTLITRINEEIEKRVPSTAAPATTDATATTAPADAATKKPKRKKESGVPLKFLRSINKRLLTLQSDASKMMKLKNKTSRDNTKSGLMKPVGISDALFKFLKGAGFEVDKNGQYARVEITRKIHSYVKDNNLRKETDKRVILPDNKLGTLLNYNSASAKEEMTYFRLPQYLKSHFISEKSA